jgi:hypothetical protein
MMPTPTRRLGRLAVALLLVAAVAIPGIAVAAHQFDDVPNSNVFHADIGWLADAGITKGCNPPDNTEFCPKDEVTREQMAAFMRRFAQFLGAEDGTPANADKIDGKDVTQVRSSVAWWSNDHLPDDADVSESRTVTVPTGGGTLVMVGSFDFLNNGGSVGFLDCEFRIDGTTIDPSNHRVYAQAGHWAICSTNGTVERPAGTYTISFHSSFATSTTLELDNGGFHVIVIPNA